MTSPPPELLPDFDPRKETAPRLRSILLEYDVPYGSTAKKGDLVNAYENGLRARAPALLAEWRRIRPSETGIVDGESQESGSFVGPDTDSALESDTASKSKGKGKEKVKTKKAPKKSAAKTDDEMEEQPKSRKPVKSSAKPESSKALASPAKRRLGSAALEEEEDAKRQKPEPATPAEKDRRVSLKYESGGEGGFSDYNPFQSGTEDTPDGKRRRKSSMGPSRVRQSFVPTPRKSMPATLPSSSNKVGSWLADSAPPSPATPAAVQAQLVPPRVQPQPRVVSNPGTPGNKFMVPVAQVKRMPPSVSELQRRLGEYADEEDLDADQVDEMNQLEEEFQERDRQQDADIAALSSAKKGKGKEVSKKPSPRPSGVRWDDEAVAKPKSLTQVVRNEVRKTPMPKGRVGEGRASTPGSSSRRSTAASSPEPDVASDEEDPFLQDDDIDIEEEYEPVQHAVAKRTRPSAPSSTNRFGSTLFVILLVAYALWWREEKIAVGFCDTASSSNALVVNRATSHAPSLAVSQFPPLPPAVLRVLDLAHLRPTCTPCPTHGVCSAGAFEGCSPDYVPASSALSLGGLLPVAPHCEPDTEKLMAVAVQASKAARMLKRRRGDVICRGLEVKRRRRKSVGDDEVWVFGLSAADVMDALKADNEAAGSPYPEEIIDDISRLAVLDLQSHGDAISSTIDGNMWLASKTAEMPLTCQARRAIVRHAAQHKLPLGSLLALFFSYLFGRAQVRSRIAENKRVKELVKTTLQQLRNQERLHYNDPALAPAPHVAPSHLRDLVLQAEHSPVKRQHLWRKVEKVVESNSNVRAMEVELEGEPIRAWVWNGISALDEDEGEEKRTTTGLYPRLQ